MALLSVQQVGLAGLAAAYASAAGGGDTFVPDDRTFLHIKNGGGSPITATLVTPQTVSGLAVADATVTIAAGADKFIGPITPASLFVDPATKVAQVTYSAVTSVTVAALRI